MRNDQTPLRVLFVDDEENILFSLRRLVSDESFEALTASSGETALEILRNTDNVALIVSDQRMPELTGVEFLAKAREVAPDALQIMLTGYADMAAPINLINNGGVYRYVSKPWDDEELLGIINAGVAMFCNCRDAKMREREARASVSRQLDELSLLNEELDAMLDDGPE